MKLNLSQIFDGTIYKLDIEEDLNIHTSDKAFIVERDIRIEKPVNITGSIYATDDGVYLSSKLTYEYIENCARCLTEFSQKIETVLSAKIIEESNQPNEDEEETMIYYDSVKSQLEIEDSIRTSILLSLPMKVLCDENCEGLCDKCGKNLNEGQCECTHEDIDPRLEKLKNLFD